MNNKYKFYFFRLLSVGLTLLLSGCNMVIFNPKGVIAEDEKNLIIIATLLMLIVVIPVIVLTFAFAWKYRASNTRAKYAPEWAHSTTLEIIWWAIPCVIIAILATITWKTSHDLDPYKPLNVKAKPIVIEAVALDWKWLFIYPQQNIATVNFVQFPTQVPIDFKITSDAPMNSFWIPQLGGQIYAMSGMQTQLHLMANQAGEYRGMSSNFSGPGFSGMKFIAKASSMQDFTQWVKSVKQSPNALTLNSYTQLAKPSENNMVQYYSSVQNNLFDTIKMKFMQPEGQSMAHNVMPMQSK